MYGNILVCAPDGHMLFRCDCKRANWYLKRGLAVEVSQGVINLTFEPAGRRDDNDEYTISPKGNKCVVCGTEDVSVLTRHHVIPDCFRKFLPLQYKSRNSHDVVPICIEHHVEYESTVDEFKEILFDKYGIGEVDIINLNKNLSTARLLLNSIDTIPPSRYAFISMLFSKYSGVSDVNHDTLTMYIESVENGCIEVKNRNQMLAERVVELGKLDEFVVSWRKHFVNTMKPVYLHEKWDINREVCKCK